MIGKNGIALAVRPATALMKRPEEYVTPWTDIFETRDAFILQVDMPGASKESVRIFVDKDLLTVRGTIGELHREGARILVREIVKTNYYRVFNLGQGVNKEGIEAEFAEGVLAVHIPKTEQTKTREIRIQ